MITSFVIVSTSWTLDSEWPNWGSSGLIYIDETGTRYNIHQEEQEDKEEEAELWIL